MVNSKTSLYLKNYFAAKEGGNVGIVHMIKEDTDIDYVVKTGHNFPYVAILTVRHFTL